MRSSGSDEVNFAELADAFLQLEIAQHRVNSILQSIREQQEEQQQEQHSEQQKEEVAKPYLLNSRLREGDKVKILNPNGDQQDKGVIIGTNRKKTFIIVKTPNGEEIKRIPKNLRKI